MNNEGENFFSFDLDTGGEYCGIIYFSTEIFCIENIDIKTPMVKRGLIFNKYIKPPDGALSEQNTTSIHGLTAASPKTKMQTASTCFWHNFHKFINQQVPPSKAYILAAYDSGMCDLKWVWKLTQTTNSSLSFPN